MPLAVCIALCKGDYHCFHCSVLVVGLLVCMSLGLADVVSCPPFSTCRVMSVGFSTFSVRCALLCECVFLLYDGRLIGILDMVLVYPQAMMW